MVTLRWNEIPSFTVRSVDLASVLIFYTLDMELCRGMIVNFRWEIFVIHYQLIILSETYEIQPDYLGLRGVAETSGHPNQKRTARDWDSDNWWLEKIGGWKIEHMDR